MSFASDMMRAARFEEWIGRQYDKRRKGVDCAHLGGDLSVICTRCGHCCHCAPGALAREDFQPIADRLGISVRDLVRRYITLHDNGPDKKWRPEIVRKDEEYSEAGRRLSDRGSYDTEPCIFYEEKAKIGKCRIYAVRPAHCRADTSKWPKAIADKELKALGFDCGEN